MIDCPHYQDGNCEVATQITHVPCPVIPSLCESCLRCDRPHRLNYYTATLISIHSPQTPLLRLGEIIENKPNGFGSRLAATLDFIFPDTNCKGPCKGHQDILDTWNPQYIRTHMEQIITWLQSEAKKRNLPFSRILTRFLLEGILVTTN